MNSLELDSFSVTFASRTVLDGLSWALPERGMTALMGPGGVGKSTLVRTICGANDAISYMNVAGDAQYMGRSIHSDHRPVLVPQRLTCIHHSALEWLAGSLPDRSSMTRADQRAHIVEALERLGWGAHAHHLDTPTTDLPKGTMRRFGILAALLGDPPLLCVDEPTHGLDDEDADDLLGALARQSRTRAILWVTHNQARAARHADHAALLLGGVVWEEGEADRFFGDPTTPEARDYVRTGGCTLPGEPALETPEELEAPEAPLPEPAPTTSPYGGIVSSLYPLPAQFVRASVGPRDFCWFAPGVLGGCPKPGLIRELSFDLDALRRVGITHLVTLTEEPLDTMGPIAMSIEHFPIDDMRAPSHERAAELLERIELHLHAGGRVALHCKAGMGRTGTMLAAHLIWRGHVDGDEAIAITRRIERRWIQSDEQLDFLKSFASWVRQQRGPQRGSRPTPHTEE